MVQGCGNLIDHRSDGRLIGGRDSGGRFMRPPSIYWHKYECLNFPGLCWECSRQKDACSRSGTYEVGYVKQSNGEYERKT